MYQSELVRHGACSGVQRSASTLVGAVGGCPPHMLALIALTKCHPLSVPRVRCGRREQSPLQRCCTCNARRARGRQLLPPSCPCSRGHSIPLILAGDCCQGNECFVDRHTTTTTTTTKGRNYTNTRGPSQGGHLTAAGREWCPTAVRQTPAEASRLLATSTTLTDPFSTLDPAVFPSQRTYLGTTRNPFSVNERCPTSSTSPRARRHLAPHAGRPPTPPLYLADSAPCLGHVTLPGHTRRASSVCWALRAIAAACTSGTGHSWPPGSRPRSSGLAAATMRTTMTTRATRTAAAAVLQICCVGSGGSGVVPARG